MRRDVRSPSSPEDFEATMSRPPVPVYEFTVKASGDDLVVEILEQRVTQGRGGNTGYRILFAPSSLFPSMRLSADQLGAVSDLSDTVGFVPALNDGGRQRATFPKRSGDRGWYLCAPVGQRGVVATPTGVIRTPWAS